MEFCCGCIKGTGGCLVLDISAFVALSSPAHAVAGTNRLYESGSMRAKDEGIPRSNTKRSCQGLFGFPTRHVVIALLHHCSDLHLRREATRRSCQWPRWTYFCILGACGRLLRHVDRVSSVGLQAEGTVTPPQISHV
ncbi:uncharacterized protein LY79DRAFT_321973 [Colletotrichum navitas]|uniref:Uncharacterized protein n=1 Tax=Colletotrichum navitas TaxID=681940 RepID=A0AAD8V876_9PEZI|nr:uncharacterized protein LY79DRAFT_321973 [Colletotrichum navitas]KAK1597917.1 hypothetical protein LY79DRAFT_321973 [Colletotrichum navitas]